MRRELGDEGVPILFYVEMPVSVLSRCSRTFAAMVREHLAPRESSVMGAMRRRGSPGADSECGRLQGDDRDGTEHHIQPVAQAFHPSAIYHATETLLAGKRADPFEDRQVLAVEFWTEVARHIPDWKRAKAGK